MTTPTAAEALAHMRQTYRPSADIIATTEEDQQ